MDTPKPDRFSLKKATHRGGESGDSKVAKPAGALRNAFSKNRDKRREKQRQLDAESPSSEDAPESLRVAIFSESFHPIQNGVTTSVLTLVSELRTLGNHVWVFAPENESLHERETNVVRFPSFVTQFNPEYPLAYPFLPRLTLTNHLEKLKLDIIHTHTPFILGLTGADLAIKRGIPLVTTFHTLYSQYSHYITFLPEAFTQGILEAYIPWYYNRCTQILCPSHSTADYLRLQGVERPIEVVPTGVPLPSPNSISPEAKRQVRKELEIQEDTPLLLYVGRLAPEKNLDWLLEVFRQLKLQSPKAILVLAGAGPLMSMLQTHAEELHLGDSIRFLGAKNRDQMDSLYAAADVFCFPSPSETQGLVIGEARAAGTPVVVVDAGGAPETVQEGIDGFRVAEGDSAGFVNRIVSLLQDPALRSRLSQNALINAKEHTAEKMTAKILSVYRKAGVGC